MAAVSTAATAASGSRDHAECASARRFPVQADLVSLQPSPPRRGFRLGSAAGSISRPAGAGLSGPAAKDLTLAAVLAPPSLYGQKCFGCRIDFSVRHLPNQHSTDPCHQPLRQLPPWDMPCEPDWFPD